MLRETIILLLLAGGGFLLVVIDCLRSRYTVINQGVAELRYFPTALGLIGIVIFFLYLVYLLDRFINSLIKKRRY